MDNFLTWAHRTRLTALIPRLIPCVRIPAGRRRREKHTAAPPLLASNSRSPPRTCTRPTVVLL